MGQKIWNGEAERNRYPSRHLCTSVKHNTRGLQSGLLDWKTRGGDRYMYHHKFYDKDLPHGYSSLNNVIKL